jgi:hypothetical protein
MNWYSQLGFPDGKPVWLSKNSNSHRTAMKHMTKLVGSVAAVVLILGGMIATSVAPSAQAADSAKGRVYLIGVPGAT